MEKNLKHSGTRSTEVCQREIDHAVFAREAAGRRNCSVEKRRTASIKKRYKDCTFGDWGREDRLKVVLVPEM